MAPRQDGVGGGREVEVGRVVLLVGVQVVLVGGVVVMGVVRVLQVMMVVVGQGMMGDMQEQAEDIMLGA